MTAAGEVGEGGLAEDSENLTHKQVDNSKRSTSSFASDASGARFGSCSLHFRASSGAVSTCTIPPLDEETFLVEACKIEDLMQALEERRAARLKARSLLLLTGRSALPSHEPPLKPKVQRPHTSRAPSDHARSAALGLTASSLKEERTRSSPLSCIGKMATQSFTLPAARRSSIWVDRRRMSMASWCPSLASQDYEQEEEPVVAHEPERPVCLLARSCHMRSQREAQKAVLQAAEVPVEKPEPELYSMRHRNALTLRDLSALTAAMVGVKDAGPPHLGPVQEAEPLDGPLAVAASPGTVDPL